MFSLKIVIFLIFGKKRNCPFNLRFVTAQKYIQMIHDDECYMLILNQLETRLEQEYMLKNTMRRKMIIVRLIDLVTLPLDWWLPTVDDDGNNITDEKNQFLLTATTEYNCCDINNWIKHVEHKSNPLKQCENGASKDFFFSYDDLNRNCCDCSLKYCLNQDMFVYLPSIILKAFVYT